MRAWRLNFKGRGRIIGRCWMRAELGDAEVGYTDVRWCLLLRTPFQTSAPSPRAPPSAPFRLLSSYTLPRHVTPYRNTAKRLLISSTLNQSRAKSSTGARISQSSSSERLHASAIRDRYASSVLEWRWLRRFMWSYSRWIERRGLKEREVRKRWVPREIWCYLLLS